MIEFANPLLDNLEIDDQILHVLKSTIDSGSYILGEQVQAFEKDFSKFISSNSIVGCASGTDALVLSLVNEGIGVGDEVIVPSHTATPTVSAITQVGARPVFCDVEADYYTINFDQAASLVTSKTRALIAVHLYGGCCDVQKMREFKKNHEQIIIIEDCAQAIGTTYKLSHVGSLADYGAFSFFPTKNLGAIGDAGAVSCGKTYQDRGIRQIAQYGWDKMRNVEVSGRNSRLDEIQAAILNVKLKILRKKIIRRNNIAKIYSEELLPILEKIPAIRQNTEHSFHLYVVQVDRRDDCLEYLGNQGINCGIHYRTPSHKMQAFKNYKKSSLKITEEISSKILSLPMYPGLSESNVEMIVDKLKIFLTSSRH